MLLLATGSIPADGREPIRRDDRAQQISFRVQFALRHPLLAKRFGSAVGMDLPAYNEIHGTGGLARQLVRKTQKLIAVFRTIQTSTMKRPATQTTAGDFCDLQFDVLTGHGHL